MTENNIESNKMTLTKFIPFQNEDWSLSFNYKIKDWNLQKNDKSLVSDFLNENEIFKNILNNPDEILNYPIILDVMTPFKGKITIFDENLKKDVSFDYFALIFILILYFGKKINTKIELDKNSYLTPTAVAGGLLSAINAFMNNIDLDEFDDNTPLFIGFLHAIRTYIDELTSDENHRFEEMDKIFNIFSIKFIESKGIIGGKLFFIKDVEVEISQTVYLFDSSIGYMVNSIEFTNIPKLTSDILMNINFLFKVCEGIFKWKKKNIDLLIKKFFKSDKINFFNQELNLIYLNNKIGLQNINEEFLIYGHLFSILKTNLLINTLILKESIQESVLFQSKMHS
ncbi:MAG: hypothetical protein ACFFD1_01935, partial [Candidatus Thorarchaeota archaeon]